MTASRTTPTAPPPESRDPAAPDPDPASTPLHVVLGASGGIGGAVVRELVARGHRVRAVARHRAGDLPAGVDFLAADIGTGDGARLAAAGAAVVYHCAQPAYHRWPREFPALTAAVTAGTAAAGAKLVFTDNLYMYGPITEATPQRATSRKGAVRIEMANRLLAAHAAGTLRAPCGSPSGGPPITTARAGPAAPPGSTCSAPRSAARRSRGQPHSTSRIRSTSWGTSPGDW